MSTNYWNAQDKFDRRILVLAPFGRDAAVADEVLAKVGLLGKTCASMEELLQAATNGAGALLITSEALTPNSFSSLMTLLEQQPAWSDVPVILLLPDTRQLPANSKLSTTVSQTANVTLLERPVPISTLVSSLQSALRARERQYQLREYLSEREQRTAQLETILQSMPDAIYVGNDENILVANDVALKILGFDAVAQLPGGLEWIVAHLRVRELATGKRIPFAETVFSEALEGEFNSAEVIVYDYGREEDRILRVAASPITKGAAAANMVIICTDITNRRRTEIALRESEARFRASVESMLDSLGIYSAVRDDDGNIIDFRVEYVNEAANTESELVREEQIGKRLLQSWPNHRHRGLFEDYCRVVETGEPLAREDFVNEDDDGSEPVKRVFDVHAAKLGDGLVATWRDVTERKRTQEVMREAREQLEVRVTERTAELTYTNAMLVEQMEVREKAESELRRRNQELSTLNMIMSAISSSLELPDIMATLQMLLSSELEISGGIVFFFDSLRERLERRLHWGLSPEVVEKIEAPMLKGTGLEPIVNEKKSICGDALSQVALWRSLRLNKRYPEWENFLCAPIIAKNEVLGILCLFAQSGTLGKEQLTFFTTIGQQVGVAIYNARLYEDVLGKGERLQQLAQRIISVQEEERQRVSHELHDEAGQALTALMLSLELTRANLPGELNAARESISEAVELTGETMEQIRILAHNLRTPSLDTIGLNPTLEGLCQEFSNRTELSIRYDGMELPSVPDTVALSLYRVAQEALANVAKHADAEHVYMQLKQIDTVIRLLIEDDGKGFDPKSALYGVKQAGIGLPGLRERLETLGGRLEVDSRIGGGTRLTATVPLKGLLNTGF